MKSLMIVAVLVLVSAEFVQANGNFISYPINCTADDNADPSVEIRVRIENKNGVIAGHLIDQGDQALLKCQEVQGRVGNLNYLDCVGQWQSDASAAHLSTPLFTYMPMTSIQRSTSGAGAAIAQGICHQ